MEQYNQAQLKLNGLQRQLTDTRTKLSEAEAKLAVSTDRLNHRVAGIYKSGETIGLMELLLSAKSLGDIISAIESLERVSTQDATLLAQVKKYRLLIAKTNRKLIKKENLQASTTKLLESKKKEILKQLETRKVALKKVKDEIASAESAAAAARLATIGRTRAVASPPPAPYLGRSDVPASGRGAAVVQIALAQQGKPYVWAAAGPNSFDCSGLVMYVFAKVGVSLPHSAEAQFHRGQRISRSALQPGDLIFGGSSGYVSHVGIYIGGDRYIDAPRPGGVVGIRSLSARRNYVGATRI